MGQAKSAQIDISSLPGHRVTRGTDEFTVEGDDFKIRIDQKSATIASYVLDGDTIIRDGGIPNFWRAPTDNDKGFNMERGHGEWRHAGAKRSVRGAEVKEVSAQETQVTFQLAFPDVGSSRMSLTYTIYGSGDIIVEYTFNPDGSKSYIPNVGTLFTVPGGYERVRYFGRGPDENYIGRNRGTFMGMYGTYADSMTVMYMEIGETGQRTDVKWAALTNDEGKGLLIVGSPRMEFSAQHYSPEQLTDVKLPWELKRNKDIVLRVDLHQMGLGGINSWGAEPLDAYRLFSRAEYSHKFRLAPIRKKLNDPSAYANLGFKNLETSLVDAQYPTDIYTNDAKEDPTEKVVDTEQTGSDPDTTGTEPDTTTQIPDVAGQKLQWHAEPKDYVVFNMQGRLVSSFTTLGVEDLHQKTVNAVQRSGVYLVKAKKGGQTYRISVRK